MKAKKQIIAVGGGGFTHNEDSDLDQFFLDQITKENCSIGFLPTASNDDSRKTELFYKRFKNTNFKVSHFNLVSKINGFENWISNLDAIYVGPYDLSISYGNSPDSIYKSTKMLKLYERILKKAHKYNKVAAIHCSGGETASFFSKMGFNIITLSTDLNLLKEGTEKEFYIFNKNS